MCPDPHDRIRTGHGPGCRRDGGGQKDEEEAICRRRILLHRDQPVELSASYYPIGLAEGTALAARGKIPGGAPKVFADMGLPQRSFVDRVSARPPTREEVETLDLPSRTPVIRQLRVVLTHNDQPVEASVLVKGAHLYELQYQQDITLDE